MFPVRGAQLQAQAGAAAVQAIMWKGRCEAQLSHKRLCGSAEPGAGVWRGRGQAVAYRAGTSCCCSRPWLTLAEESAPAAWLCRVEGSAPANKSATGGGGGGGGGRHPSREAEPPHSNPPGRLPSDPPIRCKLGRGAAGRMATPAANDLSGGSQTQRDRAGPKPHLNKSLPQRRCASRGGLRERVQGGGVPRRARLPGGLLRPLAIGGPRRKSDSERELTAAARDGRPTWGVCMLRCGCPQRAHVPSGMRVIWPL